MTMIKAQTLVDFISKFTTGETDDWGVANWKVQTNKSSNKYARGIGVVLQSPKGDIIECAVRLQFPTTNNEAEYEAILTGFDLAKVAKASTIVLHSDS